MSGLSKSRLMAHLQCPKRLWLQTYKPELSKASSYQMGRMNTGSQVGDVARSLYPDGVLIESGSLSQDLQDTEQFLTDKKSRPLFEATFKASNILVKVDLLLPTDDGYELGEVKSSTKVKSYHILDSAIQTWVAKQSGLPITQTNLVHICNKFIYPGNEQYDGLFTSANISEKIQPLEGLVPEWINAAQNTLSGEEPDIETGEQCKTPFDCPFNHYCSPPDKTIKFPVRILPNGGKVVSGLLEAGYKDLLKVPKDKLSKAKHLRVWNASKTGSLYLNSNAKKILDDLSWPRYYIDFETIQFVIPLWKETRPYQQIPFQWSCHIENGQGNLSQLDYLSDGQNDPRREFAETLIQAVSNHGPIIVYNAGFEKMIMRQLSRDFPDLTVSLDAIIDRVIDLLPIARKNYYHPDMMGSWSIKKVLPTIAPELSYSHLGVADGGMAMEAFAEIISPDTDTERKQQLRSDLLIYCERDTLAMVKIAHFFQEN
jgi:hypothetical protein